MTTTKSIKIAIFGVGLIGGSLGLCFKGQPGVTVVGHSPRQQSIEKYLAYGVVDAATTSFADAVEGADFIFLCVPVGSIDEYLEQIFTLSLKPGCIITDVGSTKQTIFSKAIAVQLHASTIGLNRDVHFIGGHPMAGSERSGVEAATANLFENAFYVLTPAQDTEKAAVDRLAELLKLTKSNTVIMDARSHDEIVGAISHLPHMIAVSLVNQVSGYNEGNDMYKTLAAGGFRDITRIASAEPVIWRDILLNNKEILLKLLGDWNARIAEFVEMLETSDGDSIIAAFDSAGRFRSQIPERQKGMIFSSFELFIDLSDTPGMLGRITTLHGDHFINIRNIQIYESRSDVPGVLSLSYRNQQDLDDAVKLLRQEGFTVYIR